MGSSFSNALKAQVEVENLYACGSFFMIRTALLPADEIQKDVDGKYLLNFYLTQPLFREAIAIASPSLYRTMRAYSLDMPGLLPHAVILSLLKYYLRMKTRATPFGLFSCVGYGQFADASSLKMELGDVRRHVRPDMQWINLWTSAYCNDRQAVRCLKVFKNPLALSLMGRVALVQTADIKGQSTMVSVRKTEIVDYVIQETSVPILYQELEVKAHNRFCYYEPEKVSHCIWELFQKGYILSELSPRLDVSFSLKDFIEKTTRYYEKTQEGFSIKRLFEAMEVYEKTNLGEGTALLEWIQDESSRLTQSDYSIQVDSYCPTQAAQLPRSLQPLIEKVVGILFALSSSEPPSAVFKKYQSRFLEKYGTNRLVCILELVDPHKGLGFPEDDSPAPVPSPFSQLLMKALTQNRGEQEIVLDSFLEGLHLDRDLADKAPLSAELFFELGAASQEARDCGEFTLVVNPLSFSTQAGCTLGRFLSFWDEAKRENVKDLLREEEALCPDVCFVEASFLPQHPRTANVCFYEKVRNFQLLLHYHEPSPFVIELEDIYVGGGMDFPYLYSKRLNKRILISLSTAVNPDLAPPILKTLLRISALPFLGFSPFIWRGLGHFPYLPRVRYHNAVLSPSRWYFDFGVLSIQRESKYDNVLQSLKKALQHYRVPNHVYLCNFDNKLQLDLADLMHLEILVRQLMNKGDILLFENYIMSQAGMVKSSEGLHTTEFVVPVKRRFPPKLEYTSLDSLSGLFAAFELKDRYELPGGEWLYVKLFVCREHEENFIRTHLRDFVSFLEERAIAESWFYVRYHEDQSHIRLRIKKTPGVINTEIFEQVRAWAGDLMKCNMLADFSFHTYEREIERYGGIGQLGRVEAFFHADSHAAAMLLTFSEEYGVSIEVIAAFGIIHLLSCFFGGYEQVAHFLGPMQSHSHLIEGLRQEIRKFTEWAGSIFLKLVKDQELFSGIEDLKQILAVTTDTLKECARFMDIPELQLLTTTNHFIDSLVHMRCNRLLGIDSNREQKARVIAWAIVQRLLHKK